MKMKPEHFAILQDAVAKLDTADKRKAYADRGLSSQRYRWDLLYASGVMQAMSQPLYLYLNDSHIDTALRKIVPDGPASLGIPVGQCSPKITDENRESLISAYADALIEDMDLKCLMQLALETITSNLRAYDNDELEEDMMKAYGHLLEERGGKHD